MAPMTGRAGTEALQLVMGLANSGAYFNRHRVAAALRTSRGRDRLRLALTRPSALRARLRAMRPLGGRVPRLAPRRRPTGVQRLQASPGRPAEPRPLWGSG